MDWLTDLLTDTKLPVGQTARRAFDWLKLHGAPLFDAVAVVLDRLIAAIETVAVVGAPPMPMLTGPIPATRKLLERAGVTVDDIGVFEVNEAFASVVLAWQAELRPDPARVNPRGGAIALGHPLGGSGARLLTTMLAHMRANEIELGVQTMCEGGGQANVTIIERV